MAERLSCVSVSPYRRLSQTNCSLLSRSHERSRKIWFLFALGAILTACAPRQPRLEFDNVTGDAQRDELTCQGRFREKILLTQADLGQAQSVTMQVSQVDNVTTGLTVTPAMVSSIRDGDFETLVINRDPSHAACGMRGDGQTTPATGIKDPLAGADLLRFGCQP